MEKETKMMHPSHDHIYRRPAFILLGVFFILFTNLINGQQILQLETRGKIAPLQFFLGDAISVKLQNETFWRHTILLDLNPEANTVEFSFGNAVLSEIVKIKTPRQRFRGKKWRNKLLLSSAGFYIYGPIDIATRDDPNWPLIASGVGMGILGVILKPIFDLTSKHNIGSRKRLRLLDLTLPDYLPSHY